MLMALQAQLNDESFIYFVTQKTNLGEKVINLSLRQFVIFFLFFLLCLSREFGFFVFFVRGARQFFVRVQAFFCSWCKALLVSPIHDR